VRENIVVLGLGRVCSGGGYNANISAVFIGLLERVNLSPEEGFLYSSFSASKCGMCLSSDV